ncbi:MAG: hypothetical protein Q9M50_14250 [Methylococcales bacterium]|nr:hypothetical protein [Methylococcales bacterium]
MFKKLILAVSLLFLSGCMSSKLIETSKGEPYAFVVTFGGLAQENLLELTTECKNPADKDDLSTSLATALKNRWK